MRVLVTGATGYIGGRLVPALLEAGHDVRLLARTPAKLADRSWRRDVEVVAGDVQDGATVEAALGDVDVAYYLVHSMDGQGDFRERDRVAAETFRDAAARTGTARIVYLGGLGGDEPGSEHLRSRHEVGRILAAGPVPVTELRAAVIIGSGSASFEMLRNLVDVLPVMITPRWVDTRCQPTAIRDVLRHLLAVLDDVGGDRIVEIGGPDVLTYRDMMRIYAEEAGLRRRVVLAVPVLTPRLSSLWIGLVTPLPTGLARPLVESLRTEVVVDPARRGVLDGSAPLSFRDAVRRALHRVQDLEVATTWASAELRRTGGPGPAPPRDRHADPQPDDPDWSGGTMLVDRRTATTPLPPVELFRAVRGVGGERGYAAHVLWEIRGLLDAAVGGVGMRRGRRHPDELSVGDPVDFWRVEALEPGRLLRLRAEMRLPGEAWLEYEVTPDGAGGSRLEQRARFHPRGLWGRAYWAAMVPFHALIFPRMVRRIVHSAEAEPPRARS